MVQHDYNLGEREMIQLRPVEGVKKNCVCCGEEMTLAPYEERDFCNKCFPVVCREVFDKANDGLTVAEVKEKIKKELDA